MCVMLSIRMARSSVYADVVIVFWHVWNYIPFDIFLAIRGMMKRYGLRAANFSRGCGCKVCSLKRSGGLHAYVSY